MGQSISSNLLNRKGSIADHIENSYHFQGDIYEAANEIARFIDMMRRISSIADSGL